MKTFAMDHKQAVRTAMLAKRAAQPDAERIALSRHIQERILTLPAISQAREVLLYAAVRGEVDTDMLRDALWERGVRVLLPRCRPHEAGCLDLHRVTCVDELAPGKYGIPEPDPAVCELIEAAQPEAVVVPGVAFDRTGARLGMGGGFYDRLLARMPEAAAIAPAFGFQLLDKVPSDTWDRRVHFIVTESETIEVAS